MKAIGEMGISEDTGVEGRGGLVVFCCRWAGKSDFTVGLLLLIVSVRDKVHSFFGEHEG